MSSMTKKNKSSFFNGDLKYIVSGRLNRTLAFSNGWDNFLTLKSGDPDGNVIFHDSVQGNLYVKANIMDTCAFKNINILNNQGNLYITAEFDTKADAINAIKIFPSNIVNIGVAITEPYGTRTEQPKMSKVSFVSGEFICELSALKAQSNIMKNAALDWASHVSERNYMSEKGWGKMVINYENKLAMEYNPVNMEIVNQKLESKWTSRAERIFAELANRAHPPKVSLADTIEFAFDSNTNSGR